MRYLHHDKCKGIVDKYIEYDPVIVMIDIVLISKEAQWHVLYNTEFKSYWKLFIILVMVETYGLWRRDSLFNIAVDSFCGMQNGSNNNTFFNTVVPEIFKNKCWAWEQQSRSSNNDLFIMEKDFYVQFISTFSGIVMFILTFHGLMKLTKPASSRYDVSLLRVIKGFSLANMSVLFTLPMLVWGNADTSQETKTIHYLLVFGYSFMVFFNVFTVVYGRGGARALAASAALRFLASFHVTPALRTYIL
ncbi:protein ARV1 isoform X2 [Plodia interpunctella]|uniref:protein ARV1 isoform X2 n=1 Tax=Plodia interpunctella TaxID=58824 RepID=UPI002367F9F3|nr:protein ARV1 isoform X2 [Plodia interpunctella]